MKKARLIVTLPEVLHKAILTASKHRKCSKAEVVRTSLYDYLGRFIEADEHG